MPLLTKRTDARRRFGTGRLALVLAAVAGLATLGFAIVFWWSVPTGPAAKADPENAAQVALGQEVYARHCAVCHGRQLEGQPDWRIRRPGGFLPAPPHDETGHTWHHPDQVLFEIAKYGAQPPHYPADYASDMPAFGSVLTDEEIWAVLAFIKRSWPAEIQVHQRRLTEASRDGD